ncbi:MAG TPA: hypothetical protein VKE74_08780, partial [Gemmataceae bacterium]|nr:hypothetical protein [Gemmataceae bacterium]
MRMRLALAVVVLAGSGWLASAQADEPKLLNRTEMDRRAGKVALDTVSMGVDLFNRGNHEGCYRLYQGALLAILPNLDHRPKLAGLVKEKLDRAKAMRPAEGAFVLREAIDAVLAESGGLGRPLWERLGGEKAVRA